MSVTKRVVRVESVAGSWARGANIRVGREPTSRKGHKQGGLSRLGGGPHLHDYKCNVTGHWT